MFKLYCYVHLRVFLTVPTCTVCSHVWEYVVDCIHMGLLFHSFGLLQCVRVHCGLHPHGFTVLLFWSILWSTLLTSDQLLCLSEDLVYQLHMPIVIVLHTVLKLISKEPLTHKMLISVNEAVPWVPMVILRVVTLTCKLANIRNFRSLPPESQLFSWWRHKKKGSPSNVLQMRISAILVLYSGSETLAYHCYYHA